MLYQVVSCLPLLLGYIATRAHGPLGLLSSASINCRAICQLPPLPQEVIKLLKVMTLGSMPGFTRKNAESSPPKKHGNPKHGGHENELPTGHEDQVCILR
jgi:hypothetical protein